MAILPSMVPLQSPTISAQPPLQGSDLTAKVAELEARLAKLEGVLRIGVAGDVTLKSPSFMNIEASATMQLKSPMIALN